ncbi:MAG: stage III sporulation protein AA [Clostridiales bacterium]|nr:stage III sporulation protein AA [Clostridiales bacterium]
MEAFLSNQLKSIISLLPKSFADEVTSVCSGRSVEEIRLRSGRPPQIVFSDGEYMLEELVFTKKDSSDLLEKLCRHSIYAHEDELKQGFISYDGGIRVGVCGKAVSDNGKIIRLTDVSSFNIRVANEVIGCSKDTISFIIEKGSPVSTLIVSRPGGGKTTLLRDIARCLSDGIGADAHKVCIADERCEIAGCIDGVPAYSIGARTDVFELTPKAESISMFIRTMSPEVIITDEIGSQKDAEAVKEASGCGVCIIASAHARSRDELNMRGPIRDLIESGVFKRILLLKRNGSLLRIIPLKV